jgi:MFS family permease
MFRKDLQYYKFCGYGFLKNLRFFEAFLVLFFLEKNLNFAQIGILYALKEILSNILSIPTGILADSFGRKRSMVFSFIIYIIAFLIYYSSRNYSWLICATVFFAFGEAFRQGTHKAMIIEYLNSHGWSDQKVHYYGHTRSWSQMGSALSSLMGAAIVFYHGEYKLVFLFSTLPPLLDMLLILSYPNYLDGELQTLNAGLIKQSLRNVVREFVLSFKKAELLRAISNLSIHTGFHKAVKDYIQPILQSLALTTPFLISLGTKQRASILVGGAYFIIFILTAYMSRNSGKFADRHGNLPRLLNLTMLTGFAAGIISGFSIIIGYNWIAIIFYIAIFLIENLRKPMGISYITDMMDRKIMATALSAESQAETLTAAMIAPIMGVVSDKLGIGYSLMIISGILLFTSFFYLTNNSINKN